MKQNRDFEWYTTSVHCDAFLSSKEDIVLREASSGMVLKAGTVSIYASEDMMRRIAFTINDTLARIEASESLEAKAKEDEAKEETLDDFANRIAERIDAIAKAE